MFVLKAEKLLKGFAHDFGIGIAAGPNMKCDDRLVDEHYNEDAVLVSFEFVVKGREALKAHFRNFVKWVKIKEVLSTDHFTETENSFFYEATAVTNYGVGRVYDAYHLRDDKIAYHFTGTIK